MNVFKVDARPSARSRWLLSLLPFVVFIGAYAVMAYLRHVDEPDDKVMPMAGQLWDAIVRAVTEGDRPNEIRLWADTWASGKRFLAAMAIVLVGVVLGVNMGLLPILEATFYRFLTFFDKIPAVAVLPILFIVFGTDELSKIALIVIGVFPTVTLDAYLRAKEIPIEQVHKAKTLGASEFEVVYRVVFPQVFPRVLDTIRLNFKAAIALLLVAESIAARNGLGYQIFKVIRYFDMPLILVYVVWIATLVFLLDWSVQWFIQRFYPWLNK
jgi:NitT/TauT family transport system permease protein